jgi:hypothetical protein
VTKDAHNSKTFIIDNVYPFLLLIMFTLSLFGLIPPHLPHSMFISLMRNTTEFTEQRLVNHQRLLLEVEVQVTIV